MLGDMAEAQSDEGNQTEVVDLCRDLIRIDTTNFGDDSGPGERKAAEYVAGLLEEVGIETRVYESDPGRTSVMARWGGEDGDGLLLHGHLDVVPAEASDWQLRPVLRGDRGRLPLGPRGRRHEGLRRDAADHRSGSASGRAGSRQRPITLCFTADEEAGGHRGAEVLINEHPEEFEGVTDAVGEVGGFSTTVRGRRIYLIEAAEKGMAWMKLTARGRAGHGSMVNADNAVTRLTAAVARLGAYEWPIRLTPTMEVLLGTVSELSGTEVTPGERPQPWSTSSAAPPGCSGRSSATPSTRPCCRPATRSTSSRPRPPRTSTRARCRASRTSSSTP